MEIEIVIGGTAYSERGLLAQSFGGFLQPIISGKLVNERVEGRGKSHGKSFWFGTRGATTPLI